VDQAALAHQGLLRNKRKRRQDPDLDRHLGLPAIVKKKLELPGSLYTLLQVLSVTLFEKMPISQALQQKNYTNQLTPDSNQLNLFDF
jgi:hypothetical protein